METNNQEYEKYQAAKKRVKQIKGFYANVVCYIIFISFFIFINLKYTPEHIWFYWPMCGWGIGLLFHAFGVFKIVPFFGDDWEERKIKEFMKEEEKQKEKFE
jgi:hypothetical protein